MKARSAVAPTVCGPCRPCGRRGHGDHRGHVRMRRRRLRRRRSAPPGRADRYPAAATIGPSRPPARRRRLHRRLRQRARRGRCTGVLVEGHGQPELQLRSLTGAPALPPIRLVAIETVGGGSARNGAASGCRPNASGTTGSWPPRAWPTLDRIESDLLLLEAIAGPVLLVAVFFGTLLIGVKAASPVELARRRQLEFTADASHELRTPLSVIEAEVTLSLTGPRSGDDYRATLERVGRESLRLRDIVEDLLWLARFDSEPPPPG